jgi:uncharacterized protein
MHLISYNQSFNRATATLIMLLCSTLLFGELSAQELPYVLLEDVRVPMRDGTYLAGYISYPRNATSSPVLLRLNCYARPNDVKNTERIFQLSTSLGYAFAEFNTRGKGNSEGEVEPFETDGDDAYDLIDWLSKQSWSNGEVGMNGGSYLGFTQWAALKKPHPALKTIVPMAAVAPGIDFPMPHGVFMTYTLRWLNFTTNNKFSEDDLFDDDKHWKNLSTKYFQNGVPFSRYDSLDNNPRKIFQRWISHPTFDDYWSSFLPTTKEEFARIKIPILSVTGYFDDDQRGAFYYYNLHNKFGDPESVKSHYLLIGPYDHYTAQGARHYASHQNHNFDSSAYINKIQLNIQWFNHIFKGASRPAILKDRVNYYLIGAGWQHGPSLQAIAPDTLTQYLSAGPKVHHLNIDASAKTKTELSMNFNFGLDASDTITTSAPGENYLHRENQLIFESAPLEKDFDLIGSPVADLNIKLTGVKDADIRILFFEVTRDGTSLILSEMDQRLSHATDVRKRIFLKANKIHRLRMEDTYFIAKRISKGSRIRFIVHLLHTPAHQKNYGSGKDVSLETKADITEGKLSIVIDKNHKSAVHLPGKTSSTPGEKL